MPQGFLRGSIAGFHRKRRAGSSGDVEGFALSPCPSAPFMSGCWGFLGGFCWSCGTRNDGHDVGGLLPRLARFLMGVFWLGSEHDVSVPVAGKGLDVIWPLMGSEIGLKAATLGPP